MIARRLARIAATHALRLVPKRHRFAAACALARLAPRGATFGRDQHAPFDDGPSIALLAILWVLTRDGVEYDPEVDVHGEAELEAIRASGRGMLIVSGHFGLNHVAVRWLRDHSWPVLAVRSPISHPLFVAGTHIPQPYVAPGPNALVHVRTALRSGSAVLIDVDAHEPRSDTIAVGPVHLSDASLRVAERCGAAIVYLETRLAGGRVVAKFTPGTRADLPAMFARWLSS